MIILDIIFCVGVLSKPRACGLRSNYGALFDCQHCDYHRMIENGIWVMSGNCLLGGRRPTTHGALSGMLAHISLVEGGANALDVRL